MRHARPRLLRGARRGAAAAAVVAARAQLLGQAQRACSRTASTAALPKESYLDFDHPLQQAIRRAVAHFTGVAGGGLACGHRRLLGAELRGAAGGSGAGLRPARRRRRRPGLRRRAARLCRRDDRAPGNGVGRRAQRPRAACAPGAATGSPRSAPRACRRSASAAGASGIAIKVADGAKRAACIRRRSPCSTSWACSTTRSARSSRAGGSRRSATTGGIVTGTIRPLVVLDKLPAGAATCGRGAGSPRAGVNFRRARWSVRASVRRIAARRGPESGQWPAGAAWQPGAAPAVRRDNNE